MGVIIPSRGLDELRLILDIVRDKDKLAEAVKMLDEHTKASEEAAGGLAKLKVAEEQLTESQRLLDEATKKRTEAETYARKKKEAADDAFKRREEVLRDGEKSLENAREEFNTECKIARAEMDARLVELTSQAADLEKRSSEMKMNEAKLSLLISDNESSKIKLAEAMSKLGVK